MRFAVAASLVAALPAAHAWGAVGHEIVATIAQMYLHPSVMPIICQILDQPAHKCHMATVATWADKERMKMRWSGPLHYINALDDHPSDSCAFPGPQKWAGSKGVNVLDGIKNVTTILEDWVKHDASDHLANEALKFMIHFLGDMHQPLHLVGRDKGGNGIRVMWDRRHTNLHSVWDNFLLAKQLRSVPRNYTRPLPYPKVEQALRGTIYDAYIRRILWEGVLNPWAEEVPTWLTCPTPVDQELDMDQSPWQRVLSKLNSFSLAKGGVDIEPDSEITCPYFWASAIHPLNCEIIFPKELDNYTPDNIVTDYHHGHDTHDTHEFDEHDSLAGPSTSGLIQLDTPEYAGVIEKRMILERLLAQGGVRLAGLLNYLFANESELMTSRLSILR